MKPQLPPEQLLALLAEVIREAPTFNHEFSPTDAQSRWLGRADALLEKSGVLHALGAFRAARNAIGTILYEQSRLLGALHDAYAHLELVAPAASKGAFIPAGDTWNGYAAIVRLLQTKCQDLLIIDPYLDARFFTELAPHIVAVAGARCLTSKQPQNLPGLISTSAKWSASGRADETPVQIRLAPPRTLHDRLIVMDQQDVWLVSQSLKDIAQRSPASVTRAEHELALMKVEHYADLWEQSEPLIN